MHTSFYASTTTTTIINEKKLLKKILQCMRQLLVLFYKGQSLVTKLVVTLLVVA